MQQCERVPRLEVTSRYLKWRKSSKHQMQLYSADIRVMLQVKEETGKSGK